MKNREIRVFEYDTLKIGENENELNKKEFDLLSRFHEKMKERYFSLGHNKIRFNHYVGALQVEKLTIEVLPKTGRDSDVNKWHDALVRMLKYTQKIRSRPTNVANLNYSNQTLLALYFEQFIQCGRKTSPFRERM